MLKFALAAGIVYEWRCGPSLVSLHGLGAASVRTLCAALLAWMALETGRVLLLAVMTLDDRPPARPRS